MPRYSLRTLMIVMLLSGPALAGIWRFRHVHLVEQAILLFFIVIVFYASCALLSLAITAVERLISLFLAAFRQTKRALSDRRD